MCGHVGIAGKLELKDERTMKRLLLFDYFRGPDSTGLAAIRTNGDAKIAKVASHPLDLFDMKRFTEALNGYQSRAFIGHNRLATKGGVTSVNAHPYHYDHIVGAHNGTLDAASWRELDEANGEKSEVDSQAIFMHIAKFGIEATVPKLQGAWALVWFDQNAGTLNFLRNNQRPFWYAYGKDFNRVFWSSEWRIMDDAILGGSPTKSEEQELFVDDKQFKYFQTKENWLYRFDLAKLVAGGTERPKPRVIELKGKEPVAAVSYTGVGGNFPQRNGPSTWTPSNSGSHSQTNGTATGGRKSVKDSIHLHGSTNNPLGGYLTQKQFEEIARYGCSWCSADVDFGETGIVVLEREKMVLCPSCGSTDKNQSRIYAEDFDNVAA